MGCGNSTMSASENNADIKAKVRPMIKRRIDNLKKRRNLLRDSTLSKKELLSGEDCDKTSTNNDSLERKSVPSEDSTDRGVAKIFPVVEEEEEEAKTIVKCVKGEECHEKEKTGAEETEQEIKGENECELEEYDEDEGRRICPGSPSFRFYCVTSVPQDSDDDHESHIDSPQRNVETKMIEEHPASAESGEKESARRNSKRNINKKFRKVIHKGGHVKSLLSVKSCYNSPCSTHDKAHLLQEAAA
ncbi:unnamed protein product [Rhodiola kirilowii]